MAPACPGSRRCVAVPCNISTCATACRSDPSLAIHLPGVHLYQPSQAAARSSRLSCALLPSACSGAGPCPVEETEATSHIQPCGAQPWPVVVQPCCLQSAAPTDVLLAWGHVRRVLVLHLAQLPDFCMWCMPSLLTCSRATRSTSTSRAAATCPCALCLYHQLYPTALQKDPEDKDGLVKSRSAGLGSEPSLPNRSAEMRPMESLFTVSSKQSGKPRLSPAPPTLLQAHMQVAQSMQAGSTSLAAAAHLDTSMQCGQAVQCQ